MTLETFISRHGEPAAHGMLENWERYMGVRISAAASLEERWQILMEETPLNYQRMAA
ncbi:MAG: hypothetical protein PHY92_04245 [Alphaproteobacteria bacterium]|nr:hypothetical protein [Alphaproteobacteria bacterium]